MTCLVLGRRGQLATHLRSLLPDAVFWGSNEFDLSDSSNLKDAIVRLAPAQIINAAAYTAVDKAEAEPELAWRLNAAAPASMASAARQLEIPLIHVSTDYVFDGKSQRPYRTNDPLGPHGVYAKTKLAGELAVASICDKHLILRTSWVFSEHGANFVKTMLRLGAERGSLSVVSDQRGVPTYAGDLARLIASAISNELESVPSGTYHAVGGPPTTWFEFAGTIFTEAVRHNLINKAPELCAISTDEYPTAARRPANSTLEPSEDLLSALNVGMDWRKGLETVIQSLRKEKESSN